MKLFINSFIELDKLRQRLGAPKTSYEFSTPLDKTAKIKIELKNSGIEVSADELEKVGPFLSYKDNLVMHYIKDSRYSREDLLNTTVNKRAPKFHFYNQCRTLVEMEQKGKKSRYVAFTSTTNKFKVKDSDNKEIPDVILYVCQNCLNGSGYRGFSYKFLKDKRIQAVKDFDIPTFLAENHSTYGDLLNIKPSERDEYPADWMEVSRKTRQNAKWKCSKCYVDMSKRMDGLHTHHIDKDKTNNRDDNLQVLCALCHQKHHPTMNVTKRIQRHILQQRQ